MNPTEFLGGGTQADTQAGTEAGADALQIDVISDVVCPWCFVGKRQLEDALASWRGAHPQSPAPRVVWHPFQLNPDMPHAGISRDDYLMSKFGRTDVSKLFRNVNLAAESVGLALRLDRIGRQPNTQRAHALMALARETDHQDALAEALFDAYFIASRDLTDLSVLKAVAVEAGLDATRVEQTLASPERLQAVAQADQEAREAGVSGVPLFVINGRIGVSGAQGADRLRMAMDKATA